MQKNIQQQEKENKFHAVIQCQLLGHLIIYKISTVCIMGKIASESFAVL